MVARTEAEALSTRSGSQLSGENGGAGTQLDLNRQWQQTHDPQGMYVVGPDGTPYGFTNDHGPEDITRFMDVCLARYRQHPPHPVVITAAEKQAPFSITPPATASIVRVFTRIPEPPNTCSALNKGIGRDFCWIYAEDVRRLIHAGEAARQSGRGEYALPLAIARRLARFHLVDDVRGTPDMWGAHEVRTCDFRAHTVNAQGTVRTVAFSGPFAMQTANGRRGFAGDLDGEMTVDAATARVLRFRAYADGKAWGAGTYTPNEPPGKYRLMLAFVETTDPIGRIVPPEEVATYNRDTRYRNP